MRCPKCQYIGLGETSRCRNCGYDFSLSPLADRPVADLIADDDGPAPLLDLPLEPANLPRSLTAAVDDSRSLRAPLTPITDLPLFSDEEAPLVAPPTVPRPPLAVRRPAPPPRPSRQADAAAPGLNLEAAPRRARTLEDDAPASDSAPVTASAGARLLGGIIDGALLLGIDAGVIYVTLRVTTLSPDDVRILATFPMIAFLLLLNGGYLVLFTAAGGQTIGKMAAGTRVVSEGAETAAEAVPVTFAAATIRGAALLLSLLPAGVGLLPILFRSDGRALHDRIAGTRVIRA